MHSHHAIIHFSPIAVPLPSDTHGIVAALGDGGLIDHADRLGVSMIFGHDTLTPVVEFFLIPLDGFEEAL
jgi:hypothetical protein